MSAKRLNSLMSLGILLPAGIDGFFSYKGLRSISKSSPSKSLLVSSKIGEVFTRSFLFCQSEITVP